MFGEAKDNPALVPSLSLYLILFAFFVLLNALSQTEEARLKTVAESLTAKFASVGRPASAPVLSAHIGTTLSDTDFLDGVGTALRTAFPLAVVESLRPDREVEVHVPVAALFEDNAPALRAEAAPELRRIAALMARRPPGTRFDVEIRLGGVIAREEPTARAPLAIARVGRIAAQLRAEGAPAGTVAAGLDHRATDAVRFVFYVRGENEGRIPVAPPAERL